MPGAGLNSIEWGSGWQMSSMGKVLQRKVLN